MSITIKSVTKENTGWTKEITLEREGKTHSVTLYWNDSDGYDLVFKNKTGSTPAWAWKMIEADDGDENLYVILDNLTEEKENE
jgi:hypothetical protein